MCSGISLKPYRKKLTDLQLLPANAFSWGSAVESAQAQQYFPYIKHHIQGAFDEDEYCMYDARRFTTLLTVTGMEEELGFAIKGTTDAALVLQESVAAGVAANGLRWLWELEKNPNAPTVPTDAARENIQEREASFQSKAACQAMAALLLANIHAPTSKPAITLTDLGNRHTIFWLDGNTILYYAAPNAATAWALTRAFLAHEPEGCNDGESQGDLPESLQPIAKRQMLDVQAMRASGGTMAQLVELEGSLSSNEYKASQAAVMLRQLFDLPAFCSDQGPLHPVPKNMYM